MTHELYQDLPKTRELYPNKGHRLWREYAVNQNLGLKVSTEFRHILCESGMGLGDLVSELKPQIEKLGTNHMGHNSIDSLDFSVDTRQERWINSLSGSIEDVVMAPVAVKRYVDTRRARSLNQQFERMLNLREKSYTKFIEEEAAILSFNRVFAVVNIYEQGSLSDGLMLMERVMGEKLGAYDDLPVDLARVFGKRGSYLAEKFNTSGFFGGWYSMALYLQSNGMNVDDFKPCNTIKTIKNGSNHYVVIDQGGN